MRKSTLPTMANGKAGTVRRIFAALDTLCKDDNGDMRDIVAIGSNWYPEAQSTLTGYASEYGKPADRVINMAAGISPQLGWDLNLAGAREYLATGRFSGLSQSNVRAASAMSGGGIGKGRKVNAFARAILGHHDAITIDRHILGAMGFDPNLSIHPGRYDLLADIFARWVHSRYGNVSLRDGQAGVWILQRERVDRGELVAA